jgi:hypothetical protein
MKRFDNRFDICARAAALAGAGAIIGLIALATPVFAQSNDEMACQNDAYRFCQDLIPDRGKVGACLRKNRLRLAPECRRLFSSGKKSLRRR